jgi:hypothetical protein
MPESSGDLLELVMGEGPVQLVGWSFRGWPHGFE